MLGYSLSQPIREFGFPNEIRAQILLGGKRAVGNVLGSGQLWKARRAGFKQILFLCNMT
jgi:hypothetical protein